MLIYRMAGSHGALFFIGLTILFGISGIMVQQIEFLTKNHHLNFIPAEVALEENIAILIACFGVFLEHRHYLLNKIYADKIPEHIDQFDKYSHNLGVMFIMVAILIEALDLCFLALSSWGFDFSGLKYLEIAILFMINLAASAMFIIFGVRLLKA